MMSPELIVREDLTPPTLSPPHSALSSPESVPDQATTVAQEVSRILLPLFDKRLYMLHASINAALAQITTNAQKMTWRLECWPVKALLQLWKIPGLNTKT